MRRYTSQPIGFRRNGTPVWPIAGGSAEPPADPPPADPPQDPPADPPPADPPADRGFPEGVPVAEMTTEQQVAYWRHYARQHEQRAKDRADYDALKAKADQFDELQRQQMSDHDRAVEQARSEARAEVLAEAGARMVDAHIEAAVTAQRLTQDQADVLLDGLDRTKFLTDEHTVDTAKVSALLDRFAPDKGKRFPDLGQGRRDGKVKPSVAAGAEMFEARRSKTAV